MYCPQCAQERSSEETSFCSRCGFLLTGTAELLKTGGVLPPGIADTATSPSPRSRGLKQGIFLILLTFLVVPIVAVISLALKAEPVAVAIATVLFAVGGMLRMVYALMFEASTGVATRSQAGSLEHPEGSRSHHHLSSSALHEIAGPFGSTGAWKDTSDLAIGSVTEPTTRLLEEDRAGQ